MALRRHDFDYISIWQYLPFLFSTDLLNTHSMWDSEADGKARGRWTSLHTLKQQFAGFSTAVFWGVPNHSAWLSQIPVNIQETERYRLRERAMRRETKQYLYMTISTTFQLSFSTTNQRAIQTAIKSHCQLFIFILTCSFHEHLWLMVLWKVCLVLSRER